SSNARNDFVAKLQSSSPQAFDLLCKIGNGHLDAIPATRTCLTTVRHWAPSRTSRTTEKQAQRTARNRGESGQSFRFDSKAEVSCVERDCRGHIVDHVADSCFGRIHTVIPSIKMKLTRLHDQHSRKLILRQRVMRVKVQPTFTGFGRCDDRMLTRAGML